MKSLDNRILYLVIGIKKNAAHKLKALTSCSGKRLRKLLFINLLISVHL